MSAASDDMASAVVRTEHADGSIHYRLPGPRDAGTRLTGGAAVFLVLVVPLVVPLFLVPREQLPAVLVGAVVVLGVATAIGGWFLFTRLRLVLAPRELLVCRDGLIATTRLGPLRRSTHRSLAGIDCLLIRADVTRAADLLVLSHGEAPLRLGQPLPLEQLRSFARELAEQLTRLDPSTGAAVEVREEGAGVPHTAGQPAGSRIVAVERDGSLVITIPPARLRSWGMVFLLVIGSIDLFGSLAWTVGILSSLPTGGGGVPLQMLMPGVMSTWFLGAFFVGCALYYCTRRIVLTVGRQELHIELVSLFRNRHWHWSRPQLVSITGNQQGLSIRPTQGKPTLISWPGLGKVQAESRWLAEVVWQRLQAADEPSGSGGREGTLALGEQEP